MDIKNLKWNKKKFIMLSIVSVIIISVIIGVFAFSKNNAAKSDQTTAQRTVQVARGNIEVSLSGSGTVESASTSDLMSNVQGKIIKSFFNEGDQIKKGDLLFEIDDTDAKLNIQKIENSISQTQLNVNSNLKSYSNLTITAPFDGIITGLSALAGESVNNGMNIFTITDTSKLKLTVPFSTADILNIKAGQNAEVHIQEILDTISGVVTAIDDYKYTDSNGGTVRDVEITVSNPGRLTDEMTASVDVITNSGLQGGSGICKFEYTNKQVIKASASGTFSSVNLKNNQYVKKGDVLIKIENDDILVTSQSNNLKIQDYNNQLVAAQKQLEDYKIYSPIDGTITAVNSVVGDSIKSGQTLISIRDFKQMQFSISVDELDISKVKVGQKATVTLDALEETTTKPLDGEVVYKAMEGVSTNGVSTYKVTIKINETENLLAGMNANAKIIISGSENVLTVPLEAITKMGDRAFVRVIGTADSSSQGQAGGRTFGGTKPTGENSASTGSNNRTQSSNGSNSSNVNKNANRTTNRQMSATFLANQEYYANTVMKEVELGINNDEYVEIKSGLSEGSTVVLPPLVTNSSSNSKTNTQQSGGFNMGAIGGGAFSGGSGQRPSGNFGTRQPN